MAVFAVSLTVDRSTAENERFSALKHRSVATDQASVAANVATLVADGASPTQAHVTTLNANWALLVADLAPDVVLAYNATTVITKTCLRRALEQLLQMVESSNDLTA